MTKTDLVVKTPDLVQIRKDSMEVNIGIYVNRNNVMGGDGHLPLHLLIYLSHLKNMKFN
jgi:hypothetical protein